MPGVRIFPLGPRGTISLVHVATRPGPRPDQTWLLTDGQPPLTDGPTVVDHRYGSEVRGTVASGMRWQCGSGGYELAYEVLLMPIIGGGGNFV
ncbi:hypothetical protein Tco_1362803 [Tanacetum coccineum]